MYVFSQDSSGFTLKSIHVDKLGLKFERKTSNASRHVETRWGRESDEAAGVIYGREEPT